MLYFSTNANDQSVAEAYKSHVEAVELRLYAMPYSTTPMEDAAYADLESIVLLTVVSSVGPTIGNPVEAMMAGVGTVWSLPIRDWSVTNGNTTDEAVWGVAIVDETNERILYLQKFNAAVVVAAGESAAFDFDLWFDTYRPLP